MDKRIAWIGVLWIVLLGGFLLYAALPTVTGTTVTLRLMPVDPVDLLRGDYMTLSYEVARIDSALQDWEFAPNERVYVHLTEGQDGVWVADRYSHTRPASGTFLLGMVADNDQVVFGIERYFIPEGTGKDIRIDTTWTADVAIDEKGNSRVVRLSENGVPHVFE